ncbi:MAG TPA: potassium transporter TrkG, partial [Candidatus Omnitrophota bacterium]|nr:potassium transporter TrkG [Candidatus Omnitrophota bacterium]
MINYNPEALILLSFMTAILIGTFLLKLPISVQNGQTLSWVNAFFTATSATCITGLGVIDIGTGLSFFGQIVVLVLIQIGGLGIMTLSLLFLMLLRRRSSLTTRSCLMSLSNEIDIKSIRGAVLKILSFTLTIELIGAGLLFLYLRNYHPTQTAIYSSVFHSISAFCNAGFSIYKENFLVFQRVPYVQIIAMVLAIIGGIGFVVISDFFHVFAPKKNGQRKTLSSHSKMALIGSGFLIVLGALVIWSFERSEQLSAMPLWDQIMNALFLSSASRTVGFNALDISLLSNATLFFVVILMFIGGSPGSTAGGVKVNTVFVLLCFVVSQVKGSTSTNFLKRKIPNDIVHKAAAIILISLVFVVLSVFVLQVTESI